jgi:hypothetical protein
MESAYNVGSITPAKRGNVNVKGGVVVMTSNEPAKNKHQTLIEFLHQTCLFMGIQDLDGEEYNRVFDSVGHRAHRDEDAAHKLTEAACRSAEIAKYLESAYKNMPPPPISATQLHHLWVSVYEKYTAFAELRYQKALKKQFNFLRLNQVLLITRYHRFNSARHRAIEELVKCADTLGVAGSDIVNWTKEGRSTDLNALISCSIP